MPRFAVRLFMSKDARLVHSSRSAATIRLNLAAIGASNDQQNRNGIRACLAAGYDERGFCSQHCCCLAWPRRRPPTRQGPGPSSNCGRMRMRYSPHPIGQIRVEQYCEGYGRRRLPVPVLDLRRQASKRLAAEWRRRHRSARAIRAGFRFSAEQPVAGADRRKPARVFRTCFCIGGTDLHSRPPRQNR